MKPRLLFVVNTDWFFVSHRLPIARAAVEAGYDVHVACSISGSHKEIEQIGAIIHPIGISRGGRGLLETWREFMLMAKLYEQVRPDIVHLVTIKPVLLGGVAARWKKIPAVVVAISGLGFIFLSTGWKAVARRLLVGWLYRLSLSHPNVQVIFQNRDDVASIRTYVDIPDEKIQLIRGSGVDLQRYQERMCPTGVPLVILPCRLLKDKGVLEFVEAAKIVASCGRQARFCLVGDRDQYNPSSISLDDLRRIESESNVELWGYRDDMPDVLSQATIVVLPSYREGMPKVLLEAAACGRPVVTTDVPGCRDAITPDQTGVLVAPRDASGLARGIVKLLDDADLARSFGVAGRQLAVSAFDISSVVSKHLSIYSEIFPAPAKETLHKPPSCSVI